MNRCSSVPRLSFAALAGWLVASAACADEAAIVAAVLAADPPGERVWMESGERSFLALDLASTRDGAATGSVVLVHGFDGNLDGRGVVRELRRRLPGDGWRTLSIQLPAIEPDTPAGDLDWWHERGALRITLAVRFLSESGSGPVVVLAYGGGAGAAVRYFLGGADASVVAFAALSPRYHHGLGDRSASALSDAWPKRILEIYADGDSPLVRVPIRRHRRTAAGFPDIGLRQVEIAGATHRLSGREEEVYRRVRGWLARDVAGLATAP